MAFFQSQCHHLIQSVWLLNYRYSTDVNNFRFTTCFSYPIHLIGYFATPLFIQLPLFFKLYFPLFCQLVSGFLWLVFLLLQIVLHRGFEIQHTFPMFSMCVWWSLDVSACGAPTAAAKPSAASNPRSTQIMLFVSCYCLFICRQGIDGTGLIITNRPTVAFDNGTENGGEFSFQMFFCHGLIPHLLVVRRTEKGWFKRYCIL